MPEDQIYALSLWQPWASLLVLGEKQFETRHWPIPLKHLPRTAAIHAAGRWSRAQLELCQQDPFIRISLVKHAESLAANINSGQHYLGHVKFTIDDIPIHLPLGHLIGVGGFVSCWPTEALDVAPKEAAMGNYAPGRFAFRFYEPQMITPIPSHGRRRWWRVADPRPAVTQQVSL